MPFFLEFTWGLLFSWIAGYIVAYMSGMFKEADIPVLMTIIISMAILLVGKSIAENIVARVKKCEQHKELMKRMHPLAVEQDTYAKLESPSTSGVRTSATSEEKEDGENEAPRAGSKSQQQQSSKKKGRKNKRKRN